MLVVGDARGVDTLAAITRRVAEAGVGINLIYPALDGRVVLRVDDLELARSALKP